MSEYFNALLEQIKEAEELRKIPYDYELMHGSETINLSTNDYLSLSNNEEVIDAAIQELIASGTGANASRLVSGSYASHYLLERKIAEFTRYNSCLLYGSGFMANYGLLTTILKSNDLVLFDYLIHASLIDGLLASKCKWKRFRHLDLKHLNSLLCRYKDQFEKIYIISDALFSMQGDIADLQELDAIAKSFNAKLIIDEAHSFGVYGNGRGLYNEAGIKPYIVTANLSKSLGGYGGFMLSDDISLVDYLVNKSRPFIYSTAIPSHLASAAIKSLKIIEKEQPGKKLLDNISHLKQFLQQIGMPVVVKSQIVFIKTGDSKKAVELSKRLLEQNIYLPAIRPPTIPQGEAGVRVSISLKYSLNQLKDTFIKIKEVFQSLDG